MKILQVVRQYLPSTGGMETYVSSLCRELKKRGHEADVATLDYLFKINRRLPPFERIDGTDVYRLPSLGNPRYFIAPGLLRLLPRYDLVHVHGVDFFIELLGGLRKIHGTPVVLSTHGGFFHTDWHSSFKKIYFQTVTRTALMGVDRVIACSKRDKEAFSPVARRLCLIENGIDFKGFAAVKKEAGAGARPNDALLFVGRISRNKRVDRLIATLAHVRETRPGATLTVIGPDWEGLQASLEELTGRLGLESAVTFTGALPQEELFKRLGGAGLFVSASEYEAFGLSAVEAMATATVPVLNDIGAFREFVTNGENGFLTDFENPPHAARTICDTLGMPPARLAEIGGRARESASRYDWGQTAEAIINVYEQVLREDSGHGRRPAGRKFPPERNLPQSGFAASGQPEPEGSQPSADILGLRIDNIDINAALQRIAEMMETPGCKLVVTVNPEHVMLSQNNSQIKKIINGSELNVPDGTGIVWASRLLGQPLSRRITGAGLLPRICGLCAEKSAGIFLLGGGPGVAERAAANLERMFPGLAVSTSGNDPGREIDPKTVREINDSGAAVLAVAYGSPKENFWIERNRDRLTGVRVAVGVGGALDFISGEVPRAPLALRRAGLEWLYRLWLEPSRYRRMAALPKFGWQVVRTRERNKQHHVF